MHLRRSLFVSLLVLGQFVHADPDVAPPTEAPKLTAKLGKAYRGEQWNWVFLSWEKVPNAATYDVYRTTTAGDDSAKPIATGVKATTYRDDGQEGITYYYRVKAVNAKGSSGYSNEVNVTPANPLFRDKRKYSPLRLKWNPNTDVKQVTDIFPHPVLPQRAVVSTDTGLFLTEDSGRTWSRLLEATTEKIGPVRDIAFHPIAVDTFYVASQTRGIWVTTDNGKTFRQFETKSAGMASDTVASIVVYSGDPTYRTLLAAHGESSPGISRSRDDGRTWDVVNKEYCFRRIVCSDRPSTYFLLIGSDPKQLDTRNLYSCNTAGEFVTEVQPDVIPTGLAQPEVPQTTFYLSTKESGLYRIESSQFLPEAKQLQFKGIGGWSSVGATWGPNADVNNLFVYDAAKLGLVVSSDELASSHTASDGLPVGQFIKEGACVRPNSNGTVFYAAINNSLSIGRASPDVPEVNLKPATFDLTDGNEMEKDWKKLAGEFDKFSSVEGNTVAAAKVLGQNVGDLREMYHRFQLTITARLPVQSPPISVTADLSRFGGSPDTPLFDDGKHDDGAAGDGVYGFTFACLLHWHRAAPYEWRVSFPGRLPIGVTATYPNDRHEGAVGVLGVSTHINDIDVWNGDGWPFAVHVDGDVTTQPVKNPVEIHKGSRALQINVKNGAWAVHIKSPYWLHDITSHEAIAISLRASDGEPPKEINLQLCDRPEFSPPTTTGSAAVLQGKTLGAEYQHIVVPITRLMAECPQFQSTHLDEIILSGTATAPTTLFVDELRILAKEEEPKPAPAK